jgi:hypothetical protein
MPKIVVANGETGESEERDMTPEEIKHYEEVFGLQVEENK